MQYMGGKSRIAKRISQVILGREFNREHYYEPFLGGGSMAAKMCQYFEHNHLSDVHAPLMLMWQAAYAGYKVYGDPLRFFPKDITREDYDFYKAHQDVPQAMLIGCGSGFGGIAWGSYAVADKRYPERTYHHTALDGVSRKIRAIKNATFTSGSYSDISAKSGAVIYCDPPYAGTTGYSTGAFDHAAFWEWCREQVARGCKVYVSEYNAPADFVPIWEYEATVTLSVKSNNGEATERLFVHESSV